MFTLNLVIGTNLLMYEPLESSFDVFENLYKNDTLKYLKIA